MAASGDNPIKEPGEDVLGRVSVAAAIARELRRADSSEGCVAAIMGLWGSGKTSLVNLMRLELANEPALPVLDFNPWMFSGAEQLVDSFFREFSAQLHLRQGRLDTIATEVQAYGDLLSPVGNVWIYWVSSQVSAAGLAVPGMLRARSRAFKNVASSV